MTPCAIVSRRYHIANCHDLAVAKEHGAYTVLEKGFAMAPQAITDAVTAGGLRGKGGGGAPTGPKWCLIPTPSDKPVYLAVNADESEPGTFKDRTILEKDPHLLIEGIILSSFAIGAHHAYVYIRGEYAKPAAILQQAIDEAYEAGYLGNNIQGSGFDLEVTVHRGGGAYICGEKSALLESLEGKRGHPRLKAKAPEPEWYFDCPTVVNNVETIATVPFIVEKGPEAYRAWGTEKSPGGMLFAISGHVKQPGVYEAAFGTSMQEYLDHFGGGVKNGKKLKAVIPGGSSSGILTAEEVAAATLDYEAMRNYGAGLGTGGMIVMDEDTDMVTALKNLLEFYHHESCGQCTPCREGTGWVDSTLERILDGSGTKEDIDTLLYTADTMNGKTICVFAPAVSTVIYGFLRKFRGEFEAYLEAAHA